MVFRWLDVNTYGTNGAHLVTAYESIAQAIHNCITFKKGDLIFNYEFGGEIPDALFELMDDTTESVIRDQLLEAITRWDPRIRVLPSTTITPDFEALEYQINLQIQVIGVTQLNESLSFAFALGAGGGN